MRIAILIPGLAPHDAISNDARGMTAALRADGHDVALFAQHAHGVDERVRPPQDIEGWLSSPHDVVIYHYCSGWDFALALMRRVHARRIVRYHNITPPEFFEGWSPGYVAACAEGRAQLDDFAALRCDLYLGDSPYNVEDFVARGVPRELCAVLPPFHEVAELQALTPDARRIPGGDPLILMVGRLSPNKGHLDLLDAMAACVTGSLPQAHLLILGKLDPNLGMYGEALQARIAMRGVQRHVSWLQDADGAELHAAFERASSLVMLSRHEGFCVPLIEAMALGTPVIAFASSAVPWTLADAGLLWDSVDPHLIASAIARVTTDARLRSTLSARGRERYAHAFAPDVLATGLREVMRRFSA